MANVVDISIRGTNSANAAVQAAKNDVKSLGETAAQTGKTMSAVLAADMIQQAAARVKQFVSDSINAASNLEQAVGGTAAVFGEAASQMDEFAAKSATSVGLSETQYRSLTTLIGGQLKRMTGDIDFAVSKSDELTKVGADLAATYGGTTREAVEAFSAALRGEADPAERFNLNLQITQVNAKAVEMGLARTTNEVSQSARAQATYALILEQSKDALGQFNREQDDAAHKTQVANAELENAKAALGEGLLPLYAKVAQATASMAQGFSGLPPTLQTVVAGTALVGAAMLILVPKIAAAKVAMTELGITAARTRSFIAGPWGMAIAAGVTVLGLFAAEHAKAKAQVQEFSDALNYQNLVMDDSNRQLIARKLEEEGLLKTGKELGLSEQELVDAVLGNAEAMAKLNEATKGLPAGLGAAANETGSFSKKVKDMADEVKEGQGALERKTAAVGDSTDKTKTDTDALEANVDALKDQSKALRAQFDPMVDFIEKQKEVTEKQREYTEAVKKHGKNSAEAKQAELELAGAILAAGDAAIAAQGVFDGKLSPALRATFKAAGLTEAQIRDIEQQFNAARKAGDRYAKTYNAVANLEIVVHDSGYAEYRAGERSGHAFGGAVSSAQTGGARGGEVRINEMGGEIARMPDGSVVIPHGQSTQMLYNMLGNGGMRSGPTQLEIILPRSTGLAWLDSLIEGIRYKIYTEGANDPQSYLKRA